MFRKRVPVYAYRYDGHEPLIIHTLEGNMTAMPGDWIITGIQGEPYPCKPDIFETAYEPEPDRLIGALFKRLFGWSDSRRAKVKRAHGYWPPS
jgi:hypothetical protein